MKNNTGKKRIVHFTLVIMVVMSVHTNAGLLSLSTSSWNVHSGDENHLLFSKLTASSYFSLLDLPVSVQIPLILTTRFREGAYTGNRFAPGNMSFYFGKKLELFEPRIGMVIPLFYSTDGEWIGSGNLKIRIGAGFRSGSGDYKAGFSGETMVSMNLNNPGGLLKTPSADMYASVKRAVALNSKTRIVGELLITGKYSEWKHWKNSHDGDSVIEVGIGVMPMIIAEHRFDSKWFWSVKGGIGPGYGKSNAESVFADASGRWNWSSNVALSVNRYY